MNAISKFGIALAFAAVLAAPLTALAAKKPHGHKKNKSRCTPVYVQPRVCAQTRVAVAPQVATAQQTDQGRRTFSYEPAAPVMAAPRYVAPAFRAAPQGHTWENATMKGLGQIR